MEILAKTRPRPSCIAAKIPLWILLFAGSLSTSFAYTANDANKTISSDGSLSDTRSAITYVTNKNADGWVLTVGSPGINYSWTSALTINIPHVLTVQGASPTNRPILHTVGITITASASKIITFKDFVIHNDTTNSGGLLRVNGSGLCFRLSNLKFETITDVTNVFIGSINSQHTPGPFGLIDNCQWPRPNVSTSNCIFVAANGSTDHYGWTQPMSWGTTDSVVIEDCTFTQSAYPAGSIADGYGGARTTLRHCNISNMPFIVHGKQSGASDSTLQVECYDNNFFVNDTVNGAPFLFWLRGGTATIFNNTASQSQSGVIGQGYRFTVECAESFWQSESCPLQLFYPQNYPATQQCGRGVVNGTEGSVPIYAWNNTAPAMYWGTYTKTTNFILEGRDIFTSGAQRPGYTPLVYPHPLRGGAPTPAPQLSPPSNLRIISGP